MTRADAVIVGGGFAGMCAARALASGRRKVVVLEALTGAAVSFRGELMHPLAVEGLSELGLVAPLLHAGAITALGFAVTLDKGADPIRLSYEEIPGAGTPGLVIPHPMLVACLRREVAGTRGVELRMGRRVTELLRRGEAVVGVRTAAGEEVRAPLTVVTEGRHSKLRSMIGAAEETRLLSFTAAVLTAPVDLPCPRYGHVFVGARGPILAYALANGQVRLCIDIPIDVGKGREPVAGFVRSACAPSVPEPLRGALLLALAERAPELCATHAITTRRCTAPGIALVGDSGGCAHPLTAGGMTIAVHDVRALADELDRGIPIDRALARYEVRRYAFVRAREMVVETLYDLFRRDDGGARSLRRGLLGYWCSGRRARAASLSLLSGRESRLSFFFAEYLSVALASAWSVAVGREPLLLECGRRTAAARLARTAFDQLARAARLVYVDARRRSSVGLRAPVAWAGLPVSPAQA